MGSKKAEGQVDGKRSLDRWTELYRSRKSRRADLVEELKSAHHQISPILIERRWISIGSTVSEISRLDFET